jgi:hypothetical protein
MVRLHESLDTRLPIHSAFAFLADFSNAQVWDPGVAWSKSVGSGQPEIGSSFRLGVRMGSRIAPMDYRIVVLQPNKRVVLQGAGSNVAAIDDIRFESRAGGTHIDYAADIRLEGWLRLLGPFTGRAFANIARNARDGMQRALDAMASQAPVTADSHQSTERAA